MKPLAICIIIAIVIILFILYRVRDKLSGFLRDVSIATPDDKPYSLSRTLFCLWTLVIFFALCYIGIATGVFPLIEGNTLLLMGIAGGTTVAGRAIDNVQADDPKLLRPQNDSTEGFLTDILSDANGISISRFQTLGFNLIYAAVFLSTVFTDKKLYPFEYSTLTLLGISSGAYALLKIPEGQAKSQSSN